MEKERISSFMKKEHGRMIALLSKVKTSKSEKIFSQFKELKEKHVYAEEKAIFIFYREGKRSVLADVLSQHEAIKDESDKVENLLNKKEFDKELKKLMELMKKHVAFEDREFYPRLDNELDGEEQKKMLENVKMILGNIGQKI